MSEQESNISKEAEEIVKKIKELVKKGNISRIYVKKNDETIINLPVNIGIVGGILGAATAPWIMIAAAITTIGFDCVVELQKSDGTIINLIGNPGDKKVVDANAVIIDDVQDAAGESSKNE